MTTERVKRSAVAALAALTLVFAGCAAGGSASAPAKSGNLASAGAAGSSPGGTPAGNSTGARRFGAIPVLSVTANVGPLTAGNDTAATVTPVTQSTVASQVAGVVLRVAHVAGDWVKQGEPVVVLDTSQLKLVVANAQAALENAKINYQVAQDNASKDNPKLILQLQSAQSAVGQRTEEL